MENIHTVMGFESTVNATAMLYDDDAGQKIRKLLRQYKLMEFSMSHLNEIHLSKVGRDFF